MTAGLFRCWWIILRAAASLCPAGNQHGSHSVEDNEVDTYQHSIVIDFVCDDVNMNAYTRICSCSVITSAFNVVMLLACV